MTVDVYRGRKTTTHNNKGTKIYMAAKMIASNFPNVFQSALCFTDRSQIVKILSIFHVGMVWIEKSVTRVTDWHHEAFRVMPISDPE